MDRILRSTIPYKPPGTESLIEFIRVGLREHANQTLIIDSTSNRHWTGHQIESIVSRLAKFLLDECNLSKGDVCSVYSEECDHIAIAILAIIAAGGVVNFLSDKSSGREIHDTAKVMQSKLLLSRFDLLVKIKPDIADIESSLRVISLDGLCEGFTNQPYSLSKFFDLSTECESLSLDELPERVQIEPGTDLAVIQFSSGTTGKPKPIPRTHKNLCHLVASVDNEQLMDLKPGVVIAGSLPITHRPGLWALLASVKCGSTFVIWSNLSDVHDALRMISKFRVTIFSSSLPFLSMLGNKGVQLKDEFETSSWRHIITSGAKIVNPELPKRLIQEFNLESLRQCFGMTESGWCFLIEMSNAKDNYLSVGRVCPGMEAIVLEWKSNTRLGPNQSGEIALRGPQVFPGYLTDKPTVLNRSDFTEDGWFKIGDQAYYDESGLMFIEGRFKEVMMFENNSLFFPTQIEEIITEHPAIEGACVVKVREIRRDYPYDVARACVTLKQGAEINEQELIKFVLARSPQVVLGGGVKVLDKFPRLQNGKVDKQTLSNLS